MNRTRRVWAWLFATQLGLVVAATILATAGHLPTDAFRRAPADKIGHLVAYGGLAFFGVALFGRGRRWRVIASLLIGATLEELSQRAFPTRTFDLGDLAMNVIGILIFGAAAARLTEVRWRHAGIEEVGDGRGAARGQRGLRDREGPRQ